MILPDHEIEELAKAGMIEPFNPDQLNPASYDVRIASKIIIETGDCFESFDVSQKNYYIGIHNLHNIIIPPNGFILAATIEKFNLPDDIAAQFQLKSSWARRGLGHVMAGYCDPGWHGSVLTMELKNYLQYSIIEIPIGTCIGQMVFHRLSSKCKKSYRETGRYNNDLTVKGVK